MTILFLDDMPSRVLLLRDDEKVHFVRTFEEFKEWLLMNGTPDVIGFDHDLAPEHHTALAAHNPNSQIPSGRTAAYWAIANGFIPDVAIVHSWNPDGAKAIANLLMLGGCEKIYLQMFNPGKMYIPRAVYQVNYPITQSRVSTDGRTE